MKLLCFIDNLGSGGAQRQLVNLAILFKGGGHEVEFLVYDSNDFFLPLLEAHGIPVSRIGNGSYLQRIIGCRRHLRRSDCDVVIAFLDTPNFLACLSAIGRHKWRLITNELSARKASFEDAMPRFLKLFQRFSDLLICNSVNAKSLWLGLSPWISDKIQVIYNPVLLGELECELRADAGARRRMVVVATYHEMKNPIVLVQAVAALPEDEKNRLKVDWYGATESVRGDTSVYDSTRKAAVELGLDEVMTFHPATDRIYNVMQSADIIGLFSDYEGLPNAICEAMTLGKPVIMTKVSDYQVLVDEGNGFLCASADVHGLKSAIEAMLATSDDELAAKGRESGRRAHELFDPERIVAQWTAAFGSVVERDGRS